MKLYKDDGSYDEEGITHLHAAERQLNIVFRVLMQAGFNYREAGIVLKEAATGVVLTNNFTQGRHNG